jgi:predicted SAM-dependent methyltransferase
MQKDKSTYKFLNLGCGTRYFRDWTNLDFVGYEPYVIRHNLLNGIPYPECRFDVVYHSHVLEHFSPDAGKRFTEECYRVLNPNGVLRIAIPDLEQIAKNYLVKLSSALEQEKPEAREEYEWALIELLDQLVREQSGGEMLKYWNREHLPNEAQIISRTGNEYISIRKYILERDKSATTNLSRPGFGNRLKEAIRQFLYTKLHLSESNIKVGNFRNGGEVHKWMYDRYSIKRLLLEVGFREVHITDAFQSHIPDWEKYQWLDVDENTTRKPDSLFVEAIK